MKTILRLMEDDSGVTAIEYALIAAGIGLAIIVGISGVATAINANFTNVSNAL